MFERLIEAYEKGKEEHNLRELSGYLATQIHDSGSEQRVLDKMMEDIGLNQTEIVKLRRVFRTMNPLEQLAYKLGSNQL